jgi:glycosyltransferase involved in cell wall biosynthesis
VSRRYCVITCVRNTADKLNACLRSLSTQQYANFTVVVMDDASTDGSGDVGRDWCGRMDWSYVLRGQRMGAVRNQVEAIRAVCDDPDDVIVFVDGDDRLERTDTFDILNRYYDDGALLTYGSYRPDPPDAGCAPARPYPSKVIRRNAYRASPTRHSYNHLRTFTYGLFSQLDDADFRDDRGEWFTSTPDAVMMFPCLELARGRIAFVPEVLLVYSSDLPSAEWRNDPTAVDYVNRTVLARPPK